MADVEERRPFQEERPPLGEARFEGGEVHLRGIGFHLAEVRVDGGVERQVGPDPDLGVGADTAAGDSPPGGTGCRPRASP